MSNFNCFSKDELENDTGMIFTEKEFDDICDSIIKQWERAGRENDLKEKRLKEKDEGIE